jgi:hypothetical protein
MTDRDRVVAELGPPQAGRAPDVSDASITPTAAMKVGGETGNICAANGLRY